MLDLPDEVRSIFTIGVTGNKFPHKSEMMLQWIELERLGYTVGEHSFGYEVDKIIKKIGLMTVRLDEIKSTKFRASRNLI